MKNDAQIKLLETMRSMSVALDTSFYTNHISACEVPDDVKYDRGNYVKVTIDNEISAYLGKMQSKEIVEKAVKLCAFTGTIESTYDEPLSLVTHYTDGIPSPSDIAENESNLLAFDVITAIRKIIKSEEHIVYGCKNFNCEGHITSIIGSKDRKEVFGLIRFNMNDEQIDQKMRIFKEHALSDATVYDTEYLINAVKGFIYTLGVLYLEEKE